MGHPGEMADDSQVATHYAETFGKPVAEEPVSIFCANNYVRPLGFLVLGLATLSTGSAIARSTVTERAVAARIAASEPIHPIKTRISPLPPRPDIDPKCKPAGSNQPYKVRVLIPKGVIHGIGKTEGDVEETRSLTLSNANKEGPVQIRYDVPLAGIHKRVNVILKACVKTPVLVAVGTRSSRSSTNTQPGEIIRESVKGPGLQILTVTRKSGKEIVSKKRVHALATIPLS